MSGGEPGAASFPSRGLAALLEADRTLAEASTEKGWQGRACRGGGRAAHALETAPTLQAPLSLQGPRSLGPKSAR